MDNGPVGDAAIGLTIANNRVIKASRAYTDSMHLSVKVLRKVIVGLIGFPLLIVGVILVPLPGPGLLVMFMALVLLATEFDWARKHADTIKAKLKAIYEKSRAKAEAVERRASKPKK